MTPQELLTLTGEAFPGVWRRVDEFRAGRGKYLPDWPPYVFLPVAGWYALACEYFGVDSLDADQLGMMQGLACLGTWRPTQDIIKFDADVYGSLASTGLAGDLPVEVFRRLPAWCVYVDTPGLVHGGKAHEGFFASLEWDVNTGHEELRIFFVNPAGSLHPAILHLGPWGLAQACQESNAFAVAANIAAHHDVSGARLLLPDKGLETALNLLLYVCAYGLADQEGWGASGRPAYPAPKKVKTGWRLFPPDRPRLYTLGAVYGQQIRKARAASGVQRQHTGPRPHVRRAHWHGYWIGPKTPSLGAPAERSFALRWLPPIAVAMRDEDSPDD